MTILLLDGGLGTTLDDQHGIKFTQAATPLWSSHMLVTDEGAATLETCQRDFAAAGADVLMTATYQASFAGFARTQTADFPAGVTDRADVERFLARAGQITQTAASADATGRTRPADVALSLGPYGATMQPAAEFSGVYDDAHRDEDSLVAWHVDRLRACEASGLLAAVRYVAFETLPRVDEIRAVRRAAGQVGLTKDFWTTCVFPRQDANVLPDGTTVDDVVEAMLVGGEPRPWGIGVNCTKVHKMDALVRAFEHGVRERTDDPPVLVLYPDGTNGEVYNTTTQVWEKVEGPDDGLARDPWEVQLGRVVKTSVANGVFKRFLVGGCCKASPQDIQRLGGLLKGSSLVDQ